MQPRRRPCHVLFLTATVTKYFKLPTILTTSFEEGPNRPLVPELKVLFPNAPYIARPGNINAWDNEDFVKAVKVTRKKQLPIAGIVTEGLRRAPQERDMFTNVIGEGISPREEPKDLLATESSEATCYTAPEEGSGQLQSPGAMRFIQAQRTSRMRSATRESR